MPTSGAVVSDALQGTVADAAGIVRRMGRQSDRILTTRALNRALLARQLLLERSRLSLVAALEQVGGLQTQYAPSAYVALWSRLHGFRRDDLTRALVDRDAVQATLLRSTIHTVSRADFPLFAAATRRVRQEHWLRAAGAGLVDGDMRAVADRVRALLADGPLKARELAERLVADGVPRPAWDGVGAWVDLVRVPPSGTWERRRADLFGLADDWLGEPNKLTEAEGLEHLVRRYLGAFGPAGVKDIASWAGAPPATIQPVVERLDLVRYRDERGGVLLDLADRPQPDPDLPAPVRFLPTWDATLLVHARRTLILPEEYRPRIFNTKIPQSLPTFLVDGAVAGMWRFEAGDVGIASFGPLAPAIRREIDEEAQRLAAFHADPTPPAERPGNARARTS
jgi:hypothetical protein